jgi:glutaredoxin
VGPEEIYIVYGITDCPACLRACALLMEQEIQYVFVETDFASSYRKLLKNKFDWATFPIIVKLVRHHEVLIGGYDDLMYITGTKSPAPT